MQHLLQGDINIKELRRVASKEDIFSILQRVHYEQSNHSGYHATHNKVIFC